MNQTHGHCAGGRSPTYITWQSMTARCYHSAHPRYEAYGGRGVRVCRRWMGKDGFIHFLEDMGERPPGKTLDRRDVDGHYTPANCRWATKREQRWNRRDMLHRSAPWQDEVLPLDDAYEVARVDAAHDAVDATDMPF